MDSITSETLALVLNGGSFAPTYLGYAEEDPFAVRLVFLSAGQEIEWTVDRAILHAALSSVTYQGAMDFRVRSCTEVDCPTSPPGYGAVHVRLGNSEEFAELHMNPEDISDFLADTFTLVPAGTESGRIDWDDTIAKLLD